jgi:hydrogenase maturation protease
MRVVVAGFGNVLRADDGFGVEVIRVLEQEPVPDAVELLDVGIGGIHLVQVLDHRADALIVLDALAGVDRPAGTLLVIEPDVVDVDALTPTARRDHLADVHYATPERALMLARAMQVLPATTVVLGCVPEDADAVRMGLSPAVALAVDAAAGEVRRLVTDLGVPWPNPIHP